MDQQQKDRADSLKLQGANPADSAGAKKSRNGLATTQEQVSDAYKLGTIEDAGSTR